MISGLPYCGLNSLVFDHHVSGHLSMNFQKKKKFHLILDISILTYSKWRPYSSWEVITIFTYSNSRLQTSSVNLSLHRSNADPPSEKPALEIKSPMLLFCPFSLISHCLHSFSFFSRSLHPLSSLVK